MIAKYAPGAIEEFGDEIMFLVATATTVGPRIRNYRKHLETETPKKEIRQEEEKPAVNQTPEETKIPPVEAPPETGKFDKVDEPKSIGGEKMAQRLGTKL